MAAREHGVEAYFFKKEECPKRADLSDTFCPVGRSAELLGDRAVLLILRELLFGRRRFELMAANTGAPGPQLVSARGLKMLVAEGVAGAPRL